MARIPRLANLFGGSTPSDTERAKPNAAQGTPGFQVAGGYLVTKERNAKLVGRERYRTFSDILQNTSIVAAGTRHFLNIIAQPEWNVEPALDLGDDSSDEAKAVAEFCERALFNDCGTNWTRLVRRGGQYRYYGYAFEEYKMIRNDEGRLTVDDIYQRPQHTIERWDIADTGDVLGVWQRSPQTGAENYIRREKLIYLLDDTLTDSPEGMGLFRQIVEPAERLRELVRLEATGYSRDMRGLPIARAPLAAMKKAEMTDEEVAAATQTLSSFAGIEAKDKDTYLLLDSSTYLSESENGESVSSVPQWDLQFASYSASGLDEIGKAIDRINIEIARVLGVEGLMIGTGSSGSRAASEDKSANLYLHANAALDDIGEAYERDLFGALLRYNGIDKSLRPRLVHEDVQRKDFEGMASAIRDMTQAGVAITNGDELVSEFFGMMGLTPPESMGLEGAMIGASVEEAV